MDACKVTQTLASALDLHFAFEISIEVSVDLSVSSSSERAWRRPSCLSLDRLESGDQDRANPAIPERYTLGDDVQVKRRQIAHRLDAFRPHNAPRTNPTGDYRYISSVRLPRCIRKAKHWSWNRRTTSCPRTSSRGSVHTTENGHDSSPVGR